MTNQRIRAVGTAVIVVHLFISLVHGLSHRGAGVTLTSFGYGYVAIVVSLAPLVAGVLLYTRFESIGTWLLTVSMLGSLGFGILYHFLRSGPDNVAEVHGAWHSAFFWSAVVLAIAEAVGAGVGLWVYFVIRKRGVREA